MAWLALWPFEKLGNIHNNLSVGRQLQSCAVHRTRRRPFEVDSLAVVTAAMAGTLEFVLAGFPIGSAAEVRATGVNHKQAVRSAVHPDAVFLLTLGIHTESVIRREADLKYSGRFEKCAGKKKTQKRDEPSPEKAGDRTPNQAAASFVNSAVDRPNGRDSGGGGSFGGSDGRRTDKLCSFAAGCGRFRCVRFRISRIRFRGRHP